MTHRIAALGLLLPALWIGPAMAEETSSLDRVAAVFVGFAEGATVEVGDDVLTTGQRSAPGAFAGGSEVDVAFTITEPTPCVFEVDMDYNGKSFRLAFNLHRVSAISFDDAQEKEGVVRYRVVLTGEKGMVQHLNADGTRSDGGNASPIGTSIPLVELEASAAALLAGCRPDADQLAPAPASR